MRKKAVDMLPKQKASLPIIILIGCLALCLVVAAVYYFGTVLPEIREQERIEAYKTSIEENKDSINTTVVELARNLEIQGQFLLLNQVCMQSHDEAFCRRDLEKHGISDIPAYQSWYKLNNYIVNGKRLHKDKHAFIFDLLSLMEEVSKQHNAAMHDLAIDVEGKVMILSITRSLIIDLLGEFKVQVSKLRV